MSGLSIIMPAYNEVENIRPSYETLTRALLIAGVEDYEILIMTVTDPGGKHDGTPDAAAELAKEDSRVRHFHTPFFAGLGFKYREGIHAATKDYVMLYPAHNLTEESSLVNILLRVGQADAIFTFTDNPQVRPNEARFVSQNYVRLCNILFGLNLRYYNGISVVRLDLLRQIPLTADDHSCMAEVVAYVVKSGVGYIELPQILKASARTGRAWNVENAFKVMGALGSLFWRLNIKEERLAIETKAPLQIAPELPEPIGLPNLQAVSQFVGGNVTQTLHKTLVYMAKSVANSLEPQFRSGTVNTSSFSDVFKLFGVLGSILGKIGAKIAMVDATSIPIPPRIEISTPNITTSASLTVIMPAYNEAKHLRSAYLSAKRALEKAGIGDYEILIVTNLSPQGTHDGTPDIATEIVREEDDACVRHLANDNYVGLGSKYRQGVSESSKEYVMLVPGDGEFEEESLVKLLAYVGREIIVPYIANPGVRPPERRTVSQAFTTACNAAFGLNLKYYNGLCIIPTAYVRMVPMSCDNFAYMAEILGYLIKSGARYLEVPWEIKPSESSKAFKSESVNEALETLLSVAWKIRVGGTRVKLPE